MNKTAFKNILLERRYSLLIIIVLIIISCSLLVEKQQLKFKLILRNTIPQIELTNELYKSPSDNSFSGLVKGFVVFNNQDNQPRNLNQYYIIEIGLNQNYSLEEIIAMDVLPPHSLGVVKLTKVGDSSNSMILEDASGNQFSIDKDTKTIAIKDKNGDSSRLITKDSDYHDFMWKFLQN